MDTQLNARPILPVLARTVSGCLNSAFLDISQHFTGHLFSPWILSSARHRRRTPTIHRGSTQRTISAGSWFAQGLQTSGDCARTSASVERYLPAFRFTGHWRLFSHHSPCATQAAVSREQRHGTTWECASPTNAKADLNRAGLWPRLSAKVHRVRWLCAVEIGFLPLRSFHDRQVLDPEDTDIFPTSVRCIWADSFSPGPTAFDGPCPCLILWKSAACSTSARPRCSTPVPPNAAVAIGDIFGGSLNGSPILDLVTAPTSGGLNIAQGNGNGTFQPAAPISIITSTPSASLLVGQACGPRQ